MKGQVSDYQIESSSFQDPNSSVIWVGGRLFRYFDNKASEGFKKIIASGVLDYLIKQGLVISYFKPGQSDLNRVKTMVSHAVSIIEHPVIPFISYAYEWPFSMLKDAALLLLDVQLELLQAGFILKDGRSTNVQYVNGRPTFIDLGSIESYLDGNVWAGYTQFCHKFLNPLLFQTATGIPFQPLLRSNPAGIAPELLYRLLSWPARLRRGAFSHVTMQSWLNKLFADGTDTGLSSLQQARVSRSALIRQVHALRQTITGLKTGKCRSPWLEYDPSSSYPAEASRAKQEFVEARLAALSPQVVYDCGCNAGDYSLSAARYARLVVAMDFDPAVVDALYQRCRGKQPNILPLVMDMTSPSPEQGWAQEEYHGLQQRGAADMVLWLALTHHLGLTYNIPLGKQVKWIASLGHNAIIEFVPVSDPMARTLVKWHNDPDVHYLYTREVLEEALPRHFTGTEVCHLPGSGRSLYLVSQQTT